MHIKQPPQISAFAKESISRLAHEAEHINKTPRSLSSQRTPSKPDYVKQIATWYESLPPASRYRRYMMTEFTSQFAGAYRSHAAARSIAAALRVLNFSEHRSWTKAGRNRRYWLPPKLISTKN